MHVLATAQLMGGGFHYPFDDASPYARIGASSLWPKILRLSHSKLSLSLHEIIPMSSLCLFADLYLSRALSSLLHT